MKNCFTHAVRAIPLLAALVVSAQLAAQHRNYKLIDMGTFGGALSGTNFPGDANNKAVNIQGVAVGFSATSALKLPTSNPFICGGDDNFGSEITHAFRWQNGTVSDLGALSPVEINCSNAYQVNANGEVVGFSENGQVDPLVGFNQSRAVRWRNGEIEDLGSFGGNQNEAISINNRGQIVGLSQNTISSSCVGFNFFPLGTTQLRAFLWEKGSMRDLGTLGGDCAVAYYINEQGQVAGASEKTTTPDPEIGIPPQDPFLWEGGEMTDLGTLGGAIGFPLFLNNHAEVVGFSSTSANPGACLSEGDPNCHAFLWKHGKIIDLSTTSAGGSPITPDGFNNAGEIVGAADFSSTGGSPFGAYLWRSGVATDLGAVSADCFSRAIAINSHSQVVGNSFSCDENFHNAFLWENGSIIDLNSLIPPDSPLHLVAAYDINDRGEIAGEGVPTGVDPSDVSNQGHAFLLIPCDENHRGLQGCDYSLVEEDATASGSTMPTPRLSRDAIKQLLRSVGSTPWRGRFGAQPQKKLCRPGGNAQNRLHLGLQREATMKSKILMCITEMMLVVALAMPAQLAAQHTRYELVDMGTLGGPASYLAEPGFGFGELLLNSPGEIAGKSDTSTPNKGSGNCPPICFDTKVFRWERGILTPLDGLSAVINNSDVGSINSRGWIAGDSATGDIDPVTGGQQVVAVLWKENKPIDLGTLGGLESAAAYVNDGGEVIGFSTISTSADPYSFLGGSIHTFIWENGVMRDLGTLGGPDVLPGPSCRNTRSQQVTGGSFIDSTPNPDTGFPTVHPFLWENGKMTDLGTLGGTLTAFLLDASQCVNNRGQVAGVSTLPGDQIIHPFFWDHGVLTDLGTLGGDFTVTTWLNDAGEVVGGTTTAGEAAFHATLWRDGAVIDLGTLDGDCASLAHSINSVGQIVGESDSCDGVTIRAVLWDKGKIVDLNSLILANSSLRLGVAANINDRDQIAGWGGRPSGCEDVFACGHAFLLIPCVAAEGCGSTDSISSRTESPSNTMTLTQRREITKAFIARLHARLAQRYHITGFPSAKN